jgi:hypothetical protein
MTERCECCGEGKDAVAETETTWQCNDCEQWNEDKKRSMAKAALQSPTFMNWLLNNGVGASK